MQADWEKADISVTWKAGYVGFSFLVFAVLAAIGQPDRGVVAAFSAASIILAAKIRWDARTQRWFFPLLASILLVHIYAVFGLDWAVELKPTILLAPIAFLDFCAVISLIFAAERLFAPRSTDG